MNVKNRWVLILVVLLVLATSACTLQIDRNSDGSLQVEGTMSAADLQSEIDLALRGQDINELEVDLRDGYIWVTGTYDPAGSADAAEISFRLELKPVDGAVSAEISEASWNGEPVSTERVENWNDRLNARLERIGVRHPNASLESVQVTSSEINLVWQVETRYSQE